MPRKPQRPNRGQKGKDGKRNRAFHRGLAQGNRNEKVMKREVNPAYARADADQAKAKAAAREHKTQTADWNDCLVQLDRAAPFVPRIEVAL